MVVDGVVVGVVVVVPMPKKEPGSEHICDAVDEPTLDLSTQNNFQIYFKFKKKKLFLINFSYQHIDKKLQSTREWLCM